MLLVDDLGPQRIVCLTEEPVETLYLLGAQDRIVGISGFTVRPPQARKEKPIVSVFTDANIDKILALDPDLVIGFSDIQAGIAKELIARGVTVWINNHRTVEGILKMIVQTGSLVGKHAQAHSLIAQYKGAIAAVQQEMDQYQQKPTVYFEEWYDPLISGIGWVSELIELAGGVDVYQEHRGSALAKDRIIADKSDVVRRNPDIIIASWCGKMFKKERMISREGWNRIKAVETGFVFEIKSSFILQPGPAALTDGFQQITGIIRQWHARRKG